MEPLTADWNTLVQVAVDDEDVDYDIKTEEVSPWLVALLLLLLTPLLLLLSRSRPLSVSCRS